MQKVVDSYGLVFSFFAAILILLSTTTVGVAADADKDAGKEIYQQRCSPCHGPDGKANTPTAQALNPKPADHTNGSYMNQLSNDHIRKVIKEGGASVGKSPIMPPQADLSNEQIDNLVAFVRSLASPPYEGQ
jgi:mono/diheme cytochrome c family protein